MGSCILGIKGFCKVPTYPTYPKPYMFIPLHSGSVPLAPAVAAEDGISKIEVATIWAVGNLRLNFMDLGLEV